VHYTVYTKSHNMCSAQVWLISGDTEHDAWYVRHWGDAFTLSHR